MTNLEKHLDALKGMLWGSREVDLDEVDDAVAAIEKVLSMRVAFRCDGCGEIKEGYFGAMGDAHKPSAWYSRSDKDGPQFACSRTCIETVAEQSGKTKVVLPI